MHKKTKIGQLIGYHGNPVFTTIELWHTLNGLVEFFLMRYHNVIFLHNALLAKEIC